MSRGSESLFGGLEDIIESFEDACSSGRSASIGDFLPDRHDAIYWQVLQELIRVDLDYRFRNGEPISLEDYRSDFPELFESRELLAPLAFEEYRLRLQSPAPVESSFFAERYGLDTSHWPRSTDSSSGDPKDAINSGVNATLSAGEKLLDFTIVGELGRGAFSRVYLARQSSLAGRLVVLKLSSVRLKEAERLARLQHTNIVPVYSVHDHGRHSVLCMPWFGAATLKDVIESLRSESSPATGETFLSTVTACDSKTLVSLAVSPETQSAKSREKTPTAAALPSRSPLHDLDREHSVLWIGQKLADGLIHAHGKGILHRDLKPANVLLTEDGQPMILDFNLATETQAAPSTEAMAGGTLPYMSPEQIASIDSFRSIEAAADIYSLGVILFELLTGELPFSRNSGDRQSMIEERWTHVPSPRSRNPGLSKDADSIIQKCLAPDTSKRYQNAQELAEDLTRHLQQEPLLHAKNRSVKERFLKWVRRHPRVASGTTAVVACSMILLAVGNLWWQSREQLLAADAQQKFSDLREQIPALHAQVFAAAIGEESTSETIESLNSALMPFQPDPASAGDSQVVVRLPEKDRTQLRQQISELQYFRNSLENSLTNNPNRNSNNSQPATMTGADSAITHSDSTHSDSAASSSATIENADQYRSAFQLILQRRVSEARDVLRPLSTQHPERFPVVLLHGMLERIQGAAAEAETLLTAAIALQPDCAQAWYQRGVCRYKLGKFAIAVSDFEKVLELDPSSLHAVVSRAMALQAQGKLEAALRDLNTAIERGFPETRIWLMRAAVHTALKNPDAAARDTEQGLTRTPTDARSWVARGIAQLPAHPDKAIADFHEARKLDSASHDMFRNLSMVLSEYLRQPEQSIQVLTEAMVQHPDDAYFWSGRGVLLARAGRRAEALQDGAAALQKSQEPMLIYMVACIYALTAQKNEEDSMPALKLLAVSIRENPALAGMAASDPDLNSIRQRPEFASILKAAQVLSEPVTTSPAGLQQVPVAPKNDE